MPANKSNGSKTKAKPAAKKSAAVSKQKPQETNNKRQALSQMRRMTWEIDFKTDNQEKFWDMMFDYDITFCIGPAGTGKTHLSVYYALKALAESKETRIDGIVLTRPMVAIDHEELGFFPGGVGEKVDPYMWAYWQIIEKIIGKERMELLIAADVIQVIPTALIRGMTLENKIILYDEAQNSTKGVMKSLLTRIGDNSQMIIMGDLKQSDRNGSSGLKDAIWRLEDMREIGIFEFQHEDIIRHKLISKILRRYEEPE